MLSSNFDTKCNSTCTLLCQVKRIEHGYVLNCRYIAVYPVYLSRERSKEQVGISLTGDSNRTGAGSKERMISQFRALLARDSLYLFIAMFCICLTERNSIQEDPLNFSIFNILFEIIRCVLFLNNNHTQSILT